MQLLLCRWCVNMRPGRSYSLLIFPCYAPPQARRFVADKCSFGAGGALAVAAVVFNTCLAVMSFYIYPGGRGNATVSPLLTDRE